MEVQAVASAAGDAKVKLVWIHGVHNYRVYTHATAIGKSGASPCFEVAGIQWFSNDHGPVMSRLGCIFGRDNMVPIDLCLYYVSRPHNRTFRDLEYRQTNTRFPK